MVFTVTDGCAGNLGQRIRYLEHVQARITLQYGQRGSLRLSLVSPNGTRSTLLPKRRKDFGSGQFDNWPFMSVHFWNENPIGQWRLELDHHDTPSETGKRSVLLFIKICVFERVAGFRAETRMRRIGRRRLLAPREVAFSCPVC